MMEVDKMLNVKKLENKLNEVQKRCSARLFDTKDIEETINELKQRREELLQDKICKKYLKRIDFYKEYAVPNSYKYRAETTRLSGYITRYGRIYINVSRKRADHRPYGGLIKKFTSIFD